MSSSSDNSSDDQATEVHAQPIELQQQPAEVFARSMVWLLRTEAVLTAVVAIGLALWLGRAAALAGLAGGGIGIVLTAVAALRIVAMGSNAQPEQMVTAFYRAMAMKLLLAVVLFVIVAKWFAGFFVPVLIGYSATLVAYWLALWRLKVAHNQP